MNWQAASQIISETDVKSFRHLFALQNIDVKKLRFLLACQP
jgi:hypothetical protein